MKKIKIFLAAYVNFPNAQNINCDNIARYLDKDRFEVHVMYTNKMPIDKKQYCSQGVHVHKLIHHRFIWYWSKLLTMLFANCDIYYLPKQETPDKALVKLRKGRRKLVSSIEGGVGTQIPADDTRVREWYQSMDGVFSISKYIQKTALEKWNMKTPVFYLGIDLPKVERLEKDKVSSAVWIGSIIQRKRPELLLEVAKCFPELRFTMIGDGDIQDRIKDRIKRDNLTNISLTGRLQNKEVYRYIRKADLLLMTSDMEGLPKVIGEAMAMSVPCIYINEFYDVDYVETGINGFAVSNVDEMKDKVEYLLRNPDRYQEISREAAASIQPYLWPVLIQKYEEFFASLVNENERD